MHRCCSEIQDGWYCTLEYGHFGQHEAWGGKRFIYAWDNPDGPRMPTEDPRPYYNAITEKELV